MTPLHRAAILGHRLNDLGQKFGPLCSYFGVLYCPNEYCTISIKCCLLYSVVGLFGTNYIQKKSCNAAENGIVG